VLYNLYEAQHTWLTPFRFVAEVQRGWFAHPFSPWAHAPLAKQLAASNDLFLRITQRYEKPAWRIDEAEIEVALDKPFCKLLHFKPRNAAPRNAPKVLIVAPLSGHHATLLRDTVRTLLAAHDVYVTDWIDARMVPAADGPFTLDDYVGTVREFMRHLGAERVHVIAVCQPAVPVLAATALMAAAGEAEPTVSASNCMNWRKRPGPGFSLR